MKIHDPHLGEGCIRHREGRYYMEFALKHVDTLDDGSLVLQTKNAERTLFVPTRPKTLEPRQLSLAF